MFLDESHHTSNSSHDNDKIIHLSNRNASENNGTIKTN